MRRSDRDVFSLSSHRDAQYHQVSAVGAQCCVLVKLSPTVKAGHEEHVLLSQVFFYFRSAYSFLRFRSTAGSEFIPSLVICCIVDAGLLAELTV